MTTNIKMPAVTVSASTSSAQGTLPAGSGKYIRVVNGSATSPVYVTAGANPTATASNVAVPAFGEKVFERDPNTDTVVAALLDSGTAKITFNVQGEPD